MNLIRSPLSFFRKEGPALPSATGTKTSGELIAELANGVNLVDRKQTWELAQDRKNDLEYIKRCCDAELKTMEAADVLAAPYYFERVAILCRKAKDYPQEVKYCEGYVRLAERYYQTHGTRGVADVRKGPRYQAILKRLPKARELLARSQNAA